MCIALVATGLEVEAQTPRNPPPSENLVAAAIDRASMRASSIDAFGEVLHLGTGTLGFEIIDIDLPGIGPPVQLKRHFDASGQPFGGNLNRLAEWDLQVPKITSTGGRPTAQWNAGELASLWRVDGASPLHRCSGFGAPPAYTVGANSPVRPETWWMGAELSVPGHGTQTLLRRSAAWPLAPGGNTATYPLVTSDGWAISCLGATKNGVAGEAFVARAPDGTTYRFDWFVATPLAVALGTSLPQFVPESHGPESGQIVYVFGVSLLATQVSDRFGNTVDYTYDGDKLIRIEASDGRRIDLAYVADSYGYPKLRTATVPGSPSRTWTYHYHDNRNLRLAAVVLPDGMAWHFFESAPREMVGELYKWSLGMRSPDGITADFRFQQRFKDRESSSCPVGGSTHGFHPLDPCYLVVDSLREKSYTGAGVGGTWRYYYRDELSGEKVAHTVVVDPDGTRTRYAVGNSSISALEGRVLRKDEGAQISPESNQWNLLGAARSTVFEFVSADLPVGQAPQAIANRARVERWTIPKRTTISQDGATFTRTVDAWDALGRELRATAVGPDAARTTAFAWHDDHAAWVLGQLAVASVDNVVADETSFDARAQPRVRKTFGKLAATMSYHPDGTLAAMQDGVGNTTSYSRWKRGIPQSVTFADGSTRSASVDDFGQVLSTTDATGAATCYSYDAGGRLTSMLHPSESAVGVCDMSTWHGMTRTLTQTTSASLGLAAGHWREEERSGNARKVVFYDALWRPVLSQVSDMADIAETSSESLARYDVHGRVVFSSYPVRQITDVNQVLAGTRTAYDALGRVTRVEQDSELGVLATTTAYLHDAIFRPYTLVTNPRGERTLTWYQMFDQPDHTLPISILQPGGVLTDITRDVFGKPTSITRSGPGG